MAMVMSQEENRASPLNVSNFTKALQYIRNPKVGGIVIFGVRAEGIGPNLILGPLMGLVVGAYAYGLWTLRPWVAPLSVVYAFYVPVNLVLFWYFQTGPEVPGLGVGPNERAFERLQV